MTRTRDIANGPALVSADLWRLTADITGTNADITANLERADDATSGAINGVTEASGVFSFPSTGLWLVQAFPMFAAAASDDSVELTINVTADDGGAWSAAARALGGNGSASTTTICPTACVLLDVTDTAQVKVKFSTNTLAGGTVLRGDTATNETHFLFLRVGNT